MAESVKAIHTYSDPGLDKQNTFEYELSIRLGVDGFSYAILDTNTRKFLHLEAFDLREPGRSIHVPGEDRKTDTLKLRKLLETELRWLSAPFSQVRLMIGNGSSTLVPEALFDKTEKAALFDFNMAGGPFHAENIYFDRLRVSDAVSLYHIAPDEGLLCRDFFPEAVIYHHSSVLIQALLMKYMNQDNDLHLFVNTGSSRLDIMRMKGKKLDYFNSFTYNTAEDYMYYLIFVVEQLGLNPENVQLIMTGEVERNSRLTDLVRKYVRSISFAERNSDFRYSFVFDQLPGHYYYNLLNLSLCE